MMGLLWNCKLPLFLVLIAALGVVHLLIRTSRYGAFIQGDAVAYLTIAEGFLTGDSLRQSAHYPPGFPLLMSALALSGIGLREAGRLLNITAFGLSLLIAGFWLRKYVRSRLVICVSTLILGVSIPLNRYASIIHAEALFTLFLLLALICIGESIWGKKKGRFLWWALAAIFASFASVTRYAGVSVIAALVLVILLRRRAPLVDNLKSALLFGVVSSIPLAVVLAYNKIVYEKMFGGNPFPSLISINILSIPDLVISIFQRWLRYTNASDWFPLLFALAAFTLLVAGGWIAYVRYTGPRSIPLFGRTPAIVFLVFTSVYVIFIFTMDHTATNASLGRYLAVLYVPMFLVCSILVDRLLATNAEGLGGAVAKWAAICIISTYFCTESVFSARTNLHITTEAMESGSPEAFNNARWETSETINYIRANPPRTRIFSSHPHALKYWIDPPTLYSGRARRSEELVRRIKRSADGATIVWFVEPPNRSRHGFEHVPREIRELPGVETVVKLSDGIVYFIVH